MSGSALEVSYRRVTGRKGGNEQLSEENDE
jgi:hypothetical protein